MFGKKDKANTALEIYSIFDSKSRSYSELTFAPNHHVLVREILNMFKDPSQAKNQYLINAEDFAIFRVGTYDRSTGQVQGQTAEHIANMHDLRAMVEPGALSST